MLCAASWSLKPWSNTSNRLQIHPIDCKYIQSIANTSNRLHVNLKPTPKPRVLTPLACTRKLSRRPARPRVRPVSWLLRSIRRASWSILNAACCFAGLDFDRIIYCNIGNPQQLQQKPITFFRQASEQLKPHNSEPYIPISNRNTSTPATQVLALVDYPQLIDHPSSPAIFPPDAIERARAILASEPGGTG
jgi:hypothetical protein